MIAKISNTLMTFIILVVVIIAGVLLLPRLFGFHIYGVLSGSMEPSFQVGSIVYVKHKSPENVQIGDAITFHLVGNDTLVATHRIIEINDTEKTFITKGDANEYPDVEPVSFHRLIGKAMFSIPFLGYMAMFIQTKQGIITGVGIILFLIFLSLLGDVLKKDTPSEVKLKIKKGKRIRDIRDN